MRKTLNDLDDAKRWFREAQFGMFVHWGLYSILGGEWRARPVRWLGEWIMHTARIPIRGYKKDGGRWKSKEELLALRQQAAAHGCNLLLNVGPMADGRFPPEAVERLGFFAG